MKVVLFCGGLGLRLRNYAEDVPKPMVTIGYRPILWHVMKYYAHFGHKDFILCLGYRADFIKRYFLEYKEWLTNDFVLSGDGDAPELLHRDIQDWRITFVDTGLHANIGERLRKVRPYLEGEEVFLANYSDGLTDAPLDRRIEAFRKRDDVIGDFICVKPNLSLHSVKLGEDNLVGDITSITSTNILINGGFFIFRQQIFDYLEPGEELVEEPLERLIQKRALSASPYGGFWAALDTFKDQQYLEGLYAAGNAPWQVWKSEEAGDV